MSSNLNRTLLRSQSMARKNEWPLDKMCLQCDVTKKNKEDFSSSPREGAYIHGMYMEGSWLTFFVEEKLPCLISKCTILWWWYFLAYYLFVTAADRSWIHIFDVRSLCCAGARWDTQTGMIADAKLKDLTPHMPVIFIKVRGTSPGSTTLPEREK